MTIGPQGRLLVRLSSQNSEADPAFEATLGLDAFANLVRTGRIMCHLGRYREVVAVTANIDAIPRPFAVETCLRLLSRGACTIRDDRGRSRAITGGSCLAAAARLLRERRALPQTKAAVMVLLDELEQMPQKESSALPQQGKILHLRTDLWLGIKVGGAIAHTAGVAQAFAAHGMAVTLAGFEENPIAPPAITEHMLPVPRRFWDFPEMPAIAANTDLVADLDALVEQEHPSLVYHRLAAFSFVGALTARRRGLPLIVEYNGSEAWIARHWGRAFRSEELALRMETAVLNAADRIVTVSEPLRKELIHRGMPPNRIRIVMNGVDSERFCPDLDSHESRRRLGIMPTQIVLGFIGSFGVWHGVTALIEAYAKMLRSAPALRDTTRLLLIGDGPERSAAQALIAALGLSDCTILTGLVPQAHAPAMLAAADILVAPTEPNPDGTPFFGSPTKLYEYMSMGRAIVATKVAQVADVLEDGVTAVLVPPANTDDLARALRRLVGDGNERRRLGAAARAAAIERHDWRHRISAIFD